MPTTPKPINIRYTPSKRVCKLRIKQHFELTKNIIEKAGGKIDYQLLSTKLGVPHQRLTKIVNGGEITISEAVAYSQHYNISISELYKILE